MRVQVAADFTTDYREHILFQKRWRFIKRSRSLAVNVAERGTGGDGWHTLNRDRHPFLRGD